MIIDKIHIHFNSLQTTASKEINFNFVEFKKEGVDQIDYETEILQNKMCFLKTFLNGI